MAVPDDTVLCRCEGTTVGAVPQAIAEGLTDARPLKLATRAGMGPCQGRLCATATVLAIASETGRALDAAGPSGTRLPLRPVPFGAFVGDGAGQG